MFSIKMMAIVCINNYTGVARGAGSPWRDAFVAQGLLYQILKVVEELRVKHLYEYLSYISLYRLQ